MSDLGSLQQRLSLLVEDTAVRRAHERAGRESEMQESEPRRIRQERIACAWLSDIVIPRLHVLAQMLSRPGHVEQVGGGHAARLTLERSEEYPVAASVTISIAPDDRSDRTSVHVRPLLIPMLAGHPPAACFELDMDAAGLDEVARFLDDQLVGFAQSYLRVREPGSPYQRSLLVTDPVCGMTFHPADAAESHEHEGRRFHFCASSCAERFRLSPERYLKPRPGQEGAGL